MIRIGPNLVLRDEEIRVEFVRSSGPGGQNVNKVSTAVQLRFDAAGSPSLTEDVRRRLLRLAGGRVNDRGELVIDARRFRSQARNRRDAEERLVDLIRRAAAPPRPRRATRPTAASRRRRLEAKKRRGLIKSLRRGRLEDPD